MEEGKGSATRIQRQVLEAVWRRAPRSRVLASGATAIVAVSGGQDSVCLLDALYRLADRLGVRLYVAHVDHRLRGEQSRADALFVQTLAARYGLPVRLLAADVGRYRREHRLAVQAAARSARYQLLARLAHELGASGVVLGHTRDDLVETFLLNLLRGAGAEGLAGLRAEHELAVEALGPPLDELDPLPAGYALTLARPLLDVERRQTAEYCRGVGLAYRDDPSNLARDYRRNRVRLELLPALERFNPSIRRTLAATAALVRDDLEVVEAAVDEAWRRLARLEPGRVTFQRQAFVEQRTAIQRRLVRRAVAALRGSTTGLGWQAVERALDVAGRGETGRRARLTRDLELACAYGWIEIAGAAPARPLDTRSARAVRLPIPGVARVEGIGTLEAKLLEDPEEVERAKQCATSLPPSEAMLDADKLGDSAAVRGRKPGDRMQPLGMAGTRKLQDILVDARVPRSARDLVPVVEASGEIAWLVGLRVGERFKLDQGTRRVAHLRFTPVRADESGQEARG